MPSEIPSQGKDFLPGERFPVRCPGGWPPPRHALHYTHYICMHIHYAETFCVDRGAERGVRSRIHRAKFCQSRFTKHFFSHSHSQKKWITFFYLPFTVHKLLICHSQFHRVKKDYSQIHRTQSPYSQFTQESHSQVHSKKNCHSQIHRPKKTHSHVHRKTLPPLISLSWIAKLFFV